MFIEDKDDENSDEEYAKKKVPIKVKKEKKLTAKSLDVALDVKNNGTAKIESTNATNTTLTTNETNFGKIKYKIKARDLNKRREYAKKYFEENSEASSSSSSSEKTIGKYKIKIKAKRRYQPSNDETMKTKSRDEKSIESKIEKDSNQI